MLSDPDRSSRLSRNLLIAGAVVGVITVITWFAVDSGGSKNGDTGAAQGTCQIPAKAKAGTQPLPALVSTLVAPLGAPDITFTATSGPETAYSYCYDVISGAQLTPAIGLLTGHGYTQAAGADPQTQTNFTQPGATPYGVSLTVTGDLDVSRVDPAALGGLAIVWTDTQPAH